MIHSSGYEHLLLFQRIWDQFLPPTWWFTGDVTPFLISLGTKNACDTQIIHVGKTPINTKITKN